MVVVATHVPPTHTPMDPTPTTVHKVATTRPCVVVAAHHPWYAATKDHPTSAAKTAPRTWKVVMDVVDFVTYVHNATVAAHAANAPRARICVTRPLLGTHPHHP